MSSEAILNKCAIGNLQPVDDNPMIGFHMTELRRTVMHIAVKLLVVNHIVGHQLVVLHMTENLQVVSCTAGLQMLLVVDRTLRIHRLLQMQRLECSRQS